jgi:hypothetical protein
MRLHAIGIVAAVAALWMPSAGTLHAEPIDPDQALQTLRQMIVPSPEAERDYAIALAIWQREQTERGN